MTEQRAKIEENCKIIEKQWNLEKKVIEITDNLKNLKLEVIILLNFLLYF